ncbi:MAG TPA: helix-turn-helix domain-containing protein [Terriglobia bacterium]|nr:helix-turn-helix domain-containing protein [Terriglobia bacterium]
MTTNAPAQGELTLEITPGDGRDFVNGSLWFVDADGCRVVFHRHEVLYRIALGDVVHLRLVAVSLRQSGLATQEEIASAFGHSVVTQARWERQYQKDGIDGLMPQRRPGRGPDLDKTQENLVRTWFHKGFSNCYMAKQLCVDEATIRRTLHRLKLTRRRPLPPELPGIEQQIPEVLPAETEVSAATTACLDATSAEVSPAAIPSLPLPEPCGQEVPDPPESPAVSSFTLDHDPRDRSGDRALARVGLLEDAVPLFADHESLPRAGALLALPLLARHGLIEAFVKVYGSLRPSFYGLRTIVVTLFLGALLRIKRPEHWKEYRPADLGAILGLDRAPEVKTVRRKFTRMAAMERGTLLMDEVARQRIAQDEDRVAFLYVDGHVREYHGKFPLFEAKKPQRQVAAPAATDTWVHDADGEPLLVVTSEVNATLTQVLEPILADVRRLVGDQRRMTVIFDRGGFSPKLFARLIAAGFDVITYRKGKTRKLASGRFAMQRRKIDGVWRAYKVCDRPRVRVGALPAEKKAKGKSAKARQRHLWLREVRVLRDDGRQTAIFTNRQDLSAVMVAYRMFYRWRQENYFKYMDEEFALDALVEYGAKDLAETTDHRNPQWLRLTRRLKEARADQARLESELGKEAASNHETTRPTMRGFKVVHAELREHLRRAAVKVEQLREQRKKTPKRVPASDLKTLKTEKKLIADVIKMAAYQVETELLGMLQGQYARAGEEGRTLLHAAFQSSARLEVAEGELRVTIASQSSPHRTAALAGLCAELDALAIPFPGTHLRLRMAVEIEKPIIL